ncbi:MAG: ABC transporter ATP-binding protein [Natronomonas sp.]
MRVTLDAVEKYYGRTVALDGVDLTVEDGEFFTLVGPSGCGKTTTLRLLAGFESPTEGEIRFDGRSVAGVSPEKRDVGIVFQSYALFPHMDVAENVGYGLRFSEPPDGATDDERVTELLSIVGLEGFEDRSPSTLSGGQKQRVALARALAPGPDLLLLDEPMSALDARLRERLRRDVKRIQQELEVTTVYVTHDQAEALAISDRLAVMDGGRIEQVGEPKSLYRHPKTRFVAEFLGENNVFEGRIVDEANRNISDFPDEMGGSEVIVGNETFHIPVDGAAGDRVTFCVRPAELNIENGENRLIADVDTAEFLGEFVRIHLMWNDRLIVVTAAELPEGDRLTVGFDPDDVWVL